MPEGGANGGFDEAPLRAAFAGRRVLLTGHTGFKGGWLAAWLHRLGARVVGVSLPPPTCPCLHDVIGVDRLLDGRIGDIRQPASYAAALRDTDAEVLIHMAANAIVRQCHDSPVDAYQTNVVGTAVVLDAARRMPSLKAIVVVTSDKCYENSEWPWGYRENDPLGGREPYGSSKAGTELVANAFRHSYFAGRNGPQLATVRAGNVFGGGDWGDGRLLPDIVRATLAGEATDIRNPRSTRPWQHVLEPLAGYLLVAEALLTRGAEAAEAWNFGPDASGTTDVRAFAELVADAWGAGGPRFRFGPGQLVAGEAREATMLALDSAKARARLGWRPRLQLDEAVRLSIDWYRHWHGGKTDMLALTLAQIAAYAGGRADVPAAVATGDFRQCA